MSFGRRGEGDREEINNRYSAIMDNYRVFMLNSISIKLFLDLLVEMDQFGFERREGREISV